MGDNNDNELKAVLFDLDGTLTHTDPIHMLIFQQLMKPFGYDITEEFYKQRITGKHNPDIFRDLLPDTYQHDEIIAFGEMKEEKFREYVTVEKCMQPLDGLGHLLNQLEKNNYLKLAVVTNACRKNAEFMIDTLQVSKYFPVVIIGDQCARGKPHPDPYLTALKVLNVHASNSVVFEDSPSGIKSALAAGVCVIGVATTQSRDNLLGYGCSHVIENYKDVDIPLLETILRDCNKLKNAVNKQMSSNSDDKSNLPNQMNSTTTTETTTNAMNDSCNTPIQSTQHTLLSLDTWGEKGLSYWFSIVLSQGILQLSFHDLKQYTLVCKSISKPVRDYIQRNFWFQQHNDLDYSKENDDPEKRYLWYFPCNFKNVKTISTLPIKTIKIQFFAAFKSLPTFPIHLQQVTHITFGFKFNQPIGCGIKSETNNLSLSLTHLEFSTFYHLESGYDFSRFNHSVDDLPPKLTHLKLAHYFNHPIDDLPPNLKKLKCGWYYNHPVNHLPSKLTFLSLSYSFNHPVENLPSTLTHLKFSELFNQPLDKLPLSLTHLTLINYNRVNFTQSLNQLQRNFESNLEYLILSTNLVQRYERSVPPDFLRLGKKEQYKSQMVYKKQ